MHLHILPWLIHYKYLVIFPIAIIEGPIITIVSGLLSSLGVLNFAIAFVVITVGDLIGDMAYYYIGRYGKQTLLRKYGKFIGYTPEREQKIEAHFDKHFYKTLIIAKFAHGTGAIALIAAGLSKVPPKKVLGMNAITTLAKTLLLMLIGYYFGKFAFEIKDYLDYVGFAILVLAIIMYYLFAKRRFYQNL